MSEEEKKSSYILTALRNAPAPLYNVKALSSINCYACGHSHFSVQTYPFLSSPLFAGLIVLHCHLCGLSFVPFLHFNLDEYYSDLYAHNVQPFRKGSSFYNTSNPFWQQPSANHFIERADKHINLLNRYGDIRKILDFGCGVGIFLHRIKAEMKHGCEPDMNARKIVEDELGVKCINLDSAVPGTYDAIVSSHSLEHLLATDVYPTLKRFNELLNDDGIILIEVPPGADQLHERQNGFIKRGPLEPHTLFFSALSLWYLLKASGFKPLYFGIENWTNNYLKKQSVSPEEFLDCEVNYLNAIVIVAKK